MTEAQEKHLASIIEAFGELTIPKYRNGQAEHGGNLFDLTPEQLLDNAIEENIDQFTYLLTLKQQLSSNK